MFRATLLLALAASTVVAVQRCGSNVPGYIATVNGEVVVNPMQFSTAGGTAGANPCPNGMTMGDEVGSGWFSCGALSAASTLVPAGECLAVSHKETQIITISDSVATSASGTFTIHLNGLSTSPLDVNGLTETSLTMALASLEIPCGAFAVQDTVGRSFKITFNRPGDFPSLEVDASALAAGTVTVETIVEGFAAEVLRTQSFVVPFTTPMESFAVGFAGGVSTSLTWQSSQEDIQAALEALPGLDDVAVSSFTEDANNLYWSVTYVYAIRRHGNAQLHVVEPDSSGATTTITDETPVPIPTRQYIKFETQDAAFATGSTWTMGVSNSATTIPMPVNVDPSGIEAELDALWQVKVNHVTLVEDLPNRRVFEIEIPHLEPTLTATSADVEAEVWIAQEGCGF